MIQSKQSKEQIRVHIQWDVLHAYAAQPHVWSPDKHDDVIKWKHFPRNWPFVRGIHRSPVNSPHKGQWRGALMFSLICVWINDWVNNREAGDLRRHRAHHDFIVMKCANSPSILRARELCWHRESTHVMPTHHMLASNGTSAIEM